MIAVQEEAFVASDHMYRKVSEYLFREALLLDRGNYLEWLDLLSEDVRYRLVAPTITMLRAGGEDAGGEAVLLDETLGSFKVRVEQMLVPAYTISENPRPFTRRHVTNVLIDAVLDDGTICVRSNALIYRSRGLQMEPHVFSMSREDRLREIPAGFRLVRRDAYLDESVISARSVTALW